MPPTPPTLILSLDTDSFIIYIRTDDVVDKDIVEDFKTRFDTVNYELECFSIGRPLSKRKNKKAIGLIKDELGGKTMKTFVEL